LKIEDDDEDDDEVDRAGVEICSIHNTYKYKYTLIILLALSTLCTIKKTTVTKLQKKTIT